MRHCGGPNIIAKKIRVLFLRVAGFFHILKLNYLSIKMNYFADNFSWGKKIQTYLFDKEHILQGICIVDAAFVLGDRFDFYFFFSLQKVTALE